MPRNATILSFSAFVSFLFTAISSNAALSKDGVTFGDKPTFQTDDKFDYSLSRDKKAFTVGFSALEAGIGTNPAGHVPERVNSAAPIVSRVFSMVIPVTDGKLVRTTFAASAFVITSKGANATLLFDVNGQNTVVKLPPGSDRSFIPTVDFRAKDVSDIRMTVFLMVERDAAYRDASAYLNVSAIDTDLAAAQRRVAAK